MSRRNDFFDSMNFMDEVLNVIGRTFDMEYPTRPFGPYPLDIVEKDNSYDIKMNVPGFKKEDIDISLKDEMITISSKKEEDKKEDNEKYLVRERISKSFSRSFKVPSDASKSDIIARMEDGVLYISIPKVEKDEETSKIDIL